MENKLVKFNPKHGTWPAGVLARKDGGKMSYHIFRHGGADILDDYYADVKGGDWLVLSVADEITETFLLADFIKI